MADWRSTLAFRRAVSEGMRNSWAGRPRSEETHIYAMSSSILPGTEEKTCGCGAPKIKCRAQNKLTHVCTRARGHDGLHHSHAAENVVFSEWI